MPAMGRGWVVIKLANDEQRSKIISRAPQLLSDNYLLCAVDDSLHIWARLDELGIAHVVALLVIMVSNYVAIP